MRRLVPTLSLTALAAAASLIGAGAASAATVPGQVTGTLTEVGTYSFVVQTPGKPVGVINALTSAANKLASKDYPYVWGGGHAQAGIASVGVRGDHNSRKNLGYDCSGSVAAVLVSGGLWPVGESVPNDAGIIRYLLSRKLIARGAGTGPNEVTLYDDPGVHIFMNINGRFWGTSDGNDGGGDSKGGPGWLDGGSWDAVQPGYHAYHFVASALKAKTNAGYSEAFQIGTAGLLGIPQPGMPVTVDYTATNEGTMVASSISYVGQVADSGTVTAIAPDGSSISITDASGAALTLTTPVGSPWATELLSGQIAVGDVVSFGYVGAAPNPLTLVELLITSQAATPPVTTPPAATTPSTPPTTPGGGGASGAGPSGTGGTGW